MKSVRRMFVKKPILTEDKNSRLLRLCSFVIVFLSLTVGVFFILRAGHMPQGNAWQKGVYTLGCALLLSACVTLFVAVWSGEKRLRLPMWACPVAAAAGGLFVLCMLYAWLGVWPIGDRSLMLVDMHHQYAPLLSELRQMLIEGDGFTYSFHVGLGVNFIPTFSYYLSSPLNLLLVLFPERYLTEGILLITLLKNAAAAAAFTACAQYLYRRRDGTMIAVGVLYSSMMYMLAYSWNIMWLDVVALLPVVVLCMERMLRSGKWPAYTLTLALALFANYYIGFMLCIFLALYMGVWLLRQPRTGRQMGVACGRFALGSLLGGGLTAALLVPTALALGRTSAAGDRLPVFDSNFPLFDLFGQFFYGAEPTIRSGNLPNLYCGVAVVVILPLYFCQKTIPLRRRLSYGGLLGVLLLSCTITQWDLLWHGLHAPNDLPYRFSFLICFVALLLTARVLACLRQVQPGHVFYSLAASALYLIVWERFGGEESAPTPVVLYANLLLLAVYGGILLLGAARRLPPRMPRQAVTWLLLAVIFGEMLVGGTRSITILHEEEHYTARDSYVDNEQTAADAAAIQHAQGLALQEGQAFCRIERLPHFSCMDTALHHYRGITTFASSNPFLTAQFMGRMGYAFNGVNSYLYNSFVPAADSLWGIRYVVLKNRITTHAQLELLDGIAVGEESRYIYRNRLALPVAFMADEQVLDFISTPNDPFYNQERLWKALTAESEDIYTKLPTQADTDGATINGSGFFKPDTAGTAKYTATVEQAGQYFAFAECRAAESITVETYKNGSLKNSWSVTTHEPYVIDMGTLQPGQAVEVTIGADEAVSGNIYLVRLNADVLQRYVDRLSAGGLQVTESTDRGLVGTIDATEEGVLFTSIPYDEGWTVKVDGQAVRTMPIDGATEGTDGALLAARIPAGKHTVTMAFRAKGQTAGLVISLLSALCVAALVLWRRYGTPRRKAAVAKHAAAQREDSPAQEMTSEE